MAREPKVMWSARLPGGLVDQIAEVAEEEGLSQGELVKQVVREWLDERDSYVNRSQRPFLSVADDAARAGLQRIEAFLTARGRGWPAKVVVCCVSGEDDGVVVGPQADPVELASDTVEFATIASAAAGKRLTVLDGEP